MVNFSRRLFICTAASLSFVRASHADNVSTASTQPTSPCFGAVLPLTGFYGLQGDEVLRGIQLALDSINAAGGLAGRPVALLTADMATQSDAAYALNGLVGQDNVNIVLGSGCSALSYPATAAAELAQVPFIELTAPADGITSRGFKFLLRTGPDTSMIGALAAQTIKTRFGGRRLGFLFNTGATAGAIAASAIAAFKAASQPLALAVAYPEDVADLQVQVERLRRAGVEVLLHAAGPDDTLLLFEAMQSLNWRPSALIGCDVGYGLRDTQLALGAALDATLVIEAPFYPRHAASIASAYEARYGVPPRSAASCTAYVGAKMVFETLNSVKNDPTKLLSALRQTALPLGALENGFGMAFDESGQNTASFVTLQSWRSGSLVPA